MSIIQLPIRLTAGALVLNSGLGKRQIDDEQAEALRDMAATGVPYFKNMEPAQFKKFLVSSEVGIGAALLIPKVPGWLAGGALTAFSAGLMSMYVNIPAMTKSDGVRPTDEGLSLAKDVVMLGAGAALVLDSAANTTKRKKKLAAKRVERIGAAKDEKVEAIQDARDEYVENVREARKELKADRKAARKAARKGNSAE